MRNERVIKDGPGWRTISRKVCFQNDYLQVCDERVKPPSRTKAMSWTVAHRKSATVIVPMTGDGRMVMIKQERIPVRQTLWEFPAGQVDETYSPTDKEILNTATRELREESGWQLSARGRLVPLGLFYTSAGFTTEHAWLFLAKPVELAPEGPAPDSSESIVEAKAFTPLAIKRMVARGEIRDANSLACYARLTAKGLL